MSTLFLSDERKIVQRKKEQWVGAEKLREKK